MLSTMLIRMFETVEIDDEMFCSHVGRDLLAVMKPDPAYMQFTDALYCFKGILALQPYSVVHILWMQGRATLVYHLQRQVYKERQVDIYPAATIGFDVVVEHVTGIVTEDTDVIGDNCSSLIRSGDDWWLRKKSWRTPSQTQEQRACRRGRYAVGQHSSRRRHHN